MIPKIIHYCWFGDNPIPDKYRQYIELWKKHCPDYSIKEWNESNFDLTSSVFSKESYEKKKWAFVSDYARLKILYEEGGIYLDVDVEVLKNLDFLLDNTCFFGTEPGGLVNTGIGFGAEKHNRIIGDMLHQYDGHFILPDGSFDMEPCPQKNTKILLNYGYVFDDSRVWKCDYATVYPPRFFCPLDYETGKVNLTEDAISIHHFGASWHSKWAEMMKPISRWCVNLFGRKRGEKVGYFVTLPLAMMNKISEIGFKGFFILLYRRYVKR